MNEITISSTSYNHEYSSLEERDKAVSEYLGVTADNCLTYKGNYPLLDIRFNPFIKDKKWKELLVGEYKLAKQRVSESRKDRESKKFIIDFDKLLPNYVEEIKNES